jgi:hypothetical protein
MTEPLNFATEQEPWNVYRLEDGTIIRAKIVMTRVMVREGAKTDEGFPVYDLRWQHIVDVTPSEISKAARQSSDLMDRLKPKDTA